MNEIKKAKEKTAMLMLPKKKVLEKSCIDVHYAKPKFKIHNKMYGLRIESEETEKLCQQKKIDAEQDYSTLILCLNVLTNCENKLNSLLYGPTCISSPEIFIKENCANWREFAFVPSKKYNPEWHEEVAKLIYTYETNINYLIELIEDERYHAIPDLLEKMQKSADAIFNNIQLVAIKDEKADADAKMAKEQLDIAEEVHEDALRTMAGLPGKIAIMNPLMR
jgi:hypothetical protein